MASRAKFLLKNVLGLFSSHSYIITWKNIQKLSRCRPEIKLFLFNFNTEELWKNLFLALSFHSPFLPPSFLGQCSGKKAKTHLTLSARKDLNYFMQSTPERARENCKEFPHQSAFFTRRKLSTEITPGRWRKYFVLKCLYAYQLIVIFLLFFFMLRQINTNEYVLWLLLIVYRMVVGWSREHKHAWQLTFKCPTNGRQLFLF